MSKVMKPGTSQESQETGRAESGNLGGHLERGQVTDLGGPPPSDASRKPQRETFWAGEM